MDVTLETLRKGDVTRAGRSNLPRRYTTTLRALRCKKGTLQFVLISAKGHRVREPRRRLASETEREKQLNPPENKVDWMYRHVTSECNSRELFFIFVLFVDLLLRTVSVPVSADKRKWRADRISRYTQRPRTSINIENRSSRSTIYYKPRGIPPYPMFNVEDVGSRYP